MSDLQKTISPSESLAEVQKICSEQAEEISKLKKRIEHDTEALEIAIDTLDYAIKKLPTKYRNEFTRVSVELSNYMIERVKR
jgi:hypothetical protein